MSSSLLGRSAVSSLLAFAFASAAACGDNDPIPGPKDADAGGEGAVDPPEPFRATVRRTSAGVPHVKADDFGGVGYGYGYAFAEDNLCILAEEILTVRGERARYFGDVPYDLGNTASQSNVNSDAFYKMLFTKAVADRYRDAQPEDLRAMVRGYAAGVSRYVRELATGGHEGRHGTCRGEAWVREINDEDLYLRYYKLNLVASTASLIDAVAAARPPTAKRAPAPGAARPPAPPAPSAAAVKEGLARVAPKLIARRDGDIGSNMYAFGSETTGGGGIQFGNPHFPWYGGERLYQVHLTVPGKMDVQGASLYGVPIVLIGFTNEVAWSHTVSTAHRFTPYKLKLVGDPMVYEKDGVEKAIEEVPVEVAVRQANGEITSQTVMLYRSEYGPMVYLGNPAFGWTLDQAFTIRDANTENVRLFRNYFRWNQAKSLDEFARIQREEVAVP
jgi:acyl-homoserine-lactone acylase